MIYELDDKAIVQAVFLTPTAENEHCEVCPLSVSGYYYFLVSFHSDQILLRIPRWIKDSIKPSGSLMTELVAHGFAQDPSAET